MATSQPERISPRDLAITALIQKHYTSQQIALALDVPEATVYVHRKRLEQKWDDSRNTSPYL